MPHLSQVVNNSDSVHRPGQLGRSTSTVMAMTALSRTLGFLRDVILAYAFGATAAFDAFVIAFKIPNFMRRLLGEGAFSQALVPVLIEYRMRRDSPGMIALINGVAGVLGMILLGLVLIGEAGAAWLVLMFAPGFAHDPERYPLALDLTRMTLPYLFSMGLAALAGAILNSCQRFALSAFTPAILNIVLILAALFWAPRVPPVRAITVLAWGVLISGAIQLLIQWPALKNLRMLPKPTWGFRDPGVMRVMKKLLPALVGVSGAQVSLLIDNLFASFLPAGSISWLYYSDRLLYFPLGIIGVTLATVIMPHLSYHHHDDSPENFTLTLDWALRWIFAASVPAALGLCLLAGPIVATLMHRGAFTAQDVVMTQHSLMAFASGLPALMAIKIFAAAYYAKQDTSTPAKVAFLAILLNIAGNFALILPLAHAGLALATALASWFNAMLLLFFLQKRRIFQAQWGWGRLSLGIASGSFLLLAVLMLGQGDLTFWLMAKPAQAIVRLIILVFSGIGIYILGLGLAGLRWNYFKERTRS